MSSAGMRPCRLFVAKDVPTQAAMAKAISAAEGGAARASGR